MVARSALHKRFHALQFRRGLPTISLRLAYIDRSHTLWPTLQGIPEIRFAPLLCQQQSIQGLFLMKEAAPDALQLDRLVAVAVAMYNRVQVLPKLSFPPLLCQQQSIQGLFELI